MYTPIPQSDTECDHKSDVPFRELRRVAVLYIKCILILSFMLSLAACYLSYLQSWNAFRASLGPSISTRFVYNPSADKHLVIASTTYQDVSWLAGVPSEWQITRYWMDKPEAHSHLSVPKNYGREAMAYLTWIIDHYDHIPDYVVFVHGHHRSWHQHEPIAAKIRALNLTALHEENYISFRCEDNAGCERVPYLDTHVGNWSGEKHIRDFWNLLLPDEELPNYLSFKCCAQFAATRKAIQTRTKEQWISIRAPLLEDPKEFHEKHKDWFPDARITDEWLLGSMYEKLWHVFLGTGPYYCPSLEQCRQVHFSNAIVCDSDGDTAPDEPSLLEYSSCVTAFDGLGPDEPPDWARWNDQFLATSGRIRKAYAERILRQQGWKGLQHGQIITGVD